MTACSPAFAIAAADALLGSILGSFYNVLIYRLPRGRSIVRPRSSCPHCSSAIAWYDNVPVASYLLLRGRCRRCGERIAPSYVAVEIISAACAAYCVRRYGVSPEALWIYAFCSLLLVITFIDWYHRIIPDVLSLGGAVLGWAGSLRFLDITITQSLAGSAVGAGALLAVAFLYKAVRKVDGLGFGDVKLMAMIGAFMGWRSVFPILFLASLFGSVYGLYLIRKGGDGRTAVAFGSFLAPSAFLVLAFGPALWNYYLHYYFG
ncbi:MAG: prepilin peptidase [Chitinivibrionia bacterium]|nr:prepilin peptidase [Chitinivibrionia bacterium]